MTAHYDLVIEGGQIVAPLAIERADIGITGGKIAAIGSSLDDAAERIDAFGLLVLPGLIDPHVHPIHAENYRTVTEAAAFGGITTLLHHLYLEAGEDSLAAFRRAVATADQTTILDYGYHVRLTAQDTSSSLIPETMNLGVNSFKMFMAYRDRGIMIDDRGLLTAMKRISELGGIALVHAENGGCIEVLEAEAETAGRTRAVDYPATRPRWTEAEAVERVVRIAHATACPLYVVHTSCAEALAAQANAKRDGMRVYTETCPHYLLLTGDAMVEQGARAKIAPPLRTRGDVEILWNGLTSGLVDAIGSDHSAFGREDKEGLDDAIFTAGFGAPGIEHMFPLLYDRGVRRGRIPLSRLIELMSTTASRIFNLPGKGTLTVGADADVVLFDPEHPFVVDAERRHGNAYYSLYEGWVGKGLVRTVLQRGRFIVRDGALVGRPGQGQFVHRPAVLGFGIRENPVAS